MFYQFLDKHKVEFRELLNWAKYIRKKIKAGTLPGEQRLLREALPKNFIKKEAIQIALENGIQLRTLHNIWTSIMHLDY